MRWFKRERACRAVGLAVTCCALACGGKAQDDSSSEEPSYSAPPPNPASPPVAVPPSRPQQSPPMNVPPQQPPPPGPRFRERPPTEDLSRAAAQNVLRANCGPCHGPALTPTQAAGGINYIDDLDRLVEVGLLQPLSSLSSRIITVMRNGSMPPPASGYPPMTEADIDIVASYIDNPRVWPILVPEAIVDAGIDSPIVDAVDAGADGG